MKRRIARKIDNYKVMPQRLINKAMYLYLCIREHWSLSIRGKNYSTCYVMDKGGRVLIYSRSYIKCGACLKRHGKHKTTKQ